MEKLKKKLVRKQVISLLLIAVVIAVSAITIVFSNNRQTIFSRAEDNLCPCENQESCHNDRWCGNDCRYHDDQNYRCDGSFPPTPPGPNDCPCENQESCHNDRWCGNDCKYHDDQNYRCGMDPTPAGPRECSPIKQCIGPRWCGDDGRFHDDQNVNRGCISPTSSPASPTAAPTAPSPTRPPTAPSPTITQGYPPRGYSPTPVTTEVQSKCPVYCSGSYECSYTDSLYYMKTILDWHQQDNYFYRFLYYYDGVCSQDSSYTNLGYYSNELCDEDSKIAQIEDYCEETSVSTPTPLPKEAQTQCQDYCCVYECSSLYPDGNSKQYFGKYKAHHTQFNTLGNNCGILSSYSCTVSMNNQKIFDGFYSNRECSVNMDLVQLRPYCGSTLTTTPTPTPRKTYVIPLIDTTLECIRCDVYERDHKNDENYQVLYDAYCPQDPGTSVYFFDCIPFIY